MRSRFTINRLVLSRQAMLASALTAVAIVSVAVFAGLLLQRQTETRGAEGIPQGLEPLATGGVVWDLELDTERAELWFVVGNGRDAQVTRVSLDGRVAPSEMPAEAWALPPGEYSGVHREIRVLDSGGVVMSEDYGVLVLDPRSGALSRADFALDVADALPGALDPNSPLPGTWVSAIDIAGKHIYVARNNIPYLTVLDASTLEPVDRLQLDKERSGAHDILVTDSTVWLKSASGDIVRVPKSGGRIEVFVEDAFTIVPLDGENIVGTDRRGDVFTGGAEGSMRTIVAQGLPVAVAADPRGGWITFDRQRGELVRYDSETGTELGSITLPLSRVPSRMGNPPVDLPPNILDLAVDSSGDVWYSVGDDPTIYRVKNGP